MNRKLIHALGCLALLTSFATIAQADAISFAFFGSFLTPPVNIDKVGVTLKNGSVIAVSDHNTGTVFTLIGTADISTGPASSYVAAAGFLSANFSPGPGVEVEVDSIQCVGGSMPGVCLQGLLNATGSYAADFAGAGSFQAIYKVNYVSPFITSLFGDPNTFRPIGSDSFTTSTNIFANGGSTDRAELGAGSVTFQTIVPEPGTLALLGTGIVGVAGIIRRRTS